LHDYAVCRVFSPACWPIALWPEIRSEKVTHEDLGEARILSKADVSEVGEGWSDSRIIKALDTSESMLYRVRKQHRLGRKASKIFDDFALARLQCF
jgi:hypothetical protein